MDTIIVGSSVASAADVAAGNAANILPAGSASNPYATPSFSVDASTARGLSVNGGNHSRASVPAGLHVIDDMRNASGIAFNTYVITSQKFAKGSRFGPMLAKKSCVPVEQLRFPLVIFGNVGIPDDLDIPELSELFKVRNVYLDTSNEAECNWMIHVMPAAYRNEQNLIAYQEDGQIYFMSIQDIEVGDVLKVWYAPTYAAKMYVPMLQDSPHQIVNNVLQQLTMEQQHEHQQPHSHPQHHQQQQQQQSHSQQSMHQQQHVNGRAYNGIATYTQIETIVGPTTTNMPQYPQQPAQHQTSQLQQQQQPQQHTSNNSGPVALPPIQSIIKSTYPKTDYANPTNVATTPTAASVTASQHQQGVQQQQQQQHKQHLQQAQRQQHMHQQPLQYNHQQQQQHIQQPHMQQHLNNYPQQQHIQQHPPHLHQQQQPHNHPSFNAHLHSTNLNQLRSPSVTMAHPHNHHPNNHTGNNTLPITPPKTPTTSAALAPMHAVNPATQTAQSSSTTANQQATEYDASRPAATVSLVDDDDPAHSGRVTKKKVYHCEVCDKKYATMTNIYKHMRSHQLYLCSLCMRTFAHEYQIKEHKCPQGSVKTPQCQVCFKYLSNSWSLTRHMKIHAHELDESGNYSAKTSPAAAAAAGSADAASATSAFVITNVPPVLTDPAMMMGSSSSDERLHLQSVGNGAVAIGAPMFSSSGSCIGAGGTQLAAADSSSGVVHVHEVDFSEVTSCSLATSCSSDALQANGELSMLSAEHSQEYTAQLPHTQQHPAHIMQQKMMQQVAGATALIPADLADTTSLDGGAESPAASCIAGIDGDSSNGGGGNGMMDVECSVCRKRFKSESRLLKHQRTVHCARIKPPQTTPPLTCVAPAHSPITSSAKVKRPPSSMIFPQNLAPPVTPDVAKALASKLNERNPNHQYHQQQQNQQQHQQTNNTPFGIAPHQHHQIQQQQQAPLQSHQHLSTMQNSRFGPTGSTTPFASPSMQELSNHYPPSMQQPQPMRNQMQSPPKQRPHHYQQHNHHQQQQQPHPQQQQQQQHLQQMQSPQQHYQQNIVQMQQQPEHQPRHQYQQYRAQFVELQSPPLQQNPIGGHDGSGDGAVLSTVSPATTEQPTTACYTNGDNDDNEGEIQSGVGEMSTENASPADQFECDVCHKMFQKRNQLTKHRPIHDNTQFVCPYCPNAKSVKAKSTMQKHLRALHEDRIEEWKAPGFVNTLLAHIVGGTNAPDSAKTATTTPLPSSTSSTSTVSDPADTNNNLDQMLGLVSAVNADCVADNGTSPTDVTLAKRIKHKLSDPTTPPSASKHFRADNAISSSTTSPPTIIQQQQQRQHHQQHMQATAFGHHSGVNNGGSRGGNSSGSVGGAFMMFSTENVGNTVHNNINNNNNSNINYNNNHGNISSMDTQSHTKHPIERYHHRTLDSLEIVDNANGQLQVIGNNSNNNSHIVTSIPTMTNGIGGISGTILPEQAGWLSAGPVLVNGIAGGGIVMGGGSSAAVDGAASEGDGGASYDTYYEDYMVL